MAKKTKTVSKKAVKGTQNKPASTSASTSGAKASADAPYRGVGVWSTTGFPSSSTYYSPEKTMTKTSYENQGYYGYGDYTNPYSYFTNFFNPSYYSNFFAPYTQGYSAGQNYAPYFGAYNSPFYNFAPYYNQYSYYPYYYAYTKNYNDAYKNGFEAFMEMYKGYYDYFYQTYKGYYDYYQEGMDFYNEAYKTLSSCKTPEEYAKVSNEYAQKFYKQAYEANDYYAKSTKKSKAA